MDPKEFDDKRNIWVGEISNVKSGSLTNNQMENGRVALKKTTLYKKII